MKRRLFIEPLEKRLALDASLVEVLAEFIEFQDRVTGGTVTTEALERARALVSEYHDLDPQASGVFNQELPANAAGPGNIQKLELRLDSDDHDLSVGDQFVVDFYVRDTFSDSVFGTFDPSTAGLFQASFDLSFDPDVVRPMDDGVKVDEHFITKVNTDRLEEGVLGNVGGLLRSIDQRIGPDDFENGELLFASVAFETISDGDANIAATVADNPEAILVIGSDEPLPAANVTISPLEISVQPDPVDNESSELTTPLPPASLEVIPPASDRIVIPPLVDFLRSAEDQTIDLRFFVSRFDPIDQDERDSDEIFEETLLDPFSQTPTDEPESESARTEIVEEDESDEPRQKEEASEFWKDFDLSLLDDDVAQSLFRLHLRALRFRIGPAKAPNENVGQRDDAENAQVPQVIDLGYVDFSQWLSDAAYRSWQTDVDAVQPHHETVQSQTDNENSEGQTAEIAPWVPSGKTASLNRLEFAEELSEDVTKDSRDPSIALNQAADAKTKIPASDDS